MSTKVRIIARFLPDVHDAVVLVDQPRAPAHDAHADDQPGHAPRAPGSTHTQADEPFIGGVNRMTLP